jgi:hypothetical protein
MNNDLIADKLEEVIGKIFNDSRLFNPKPFEYLVLHNPIKNSSWFIIIFFTDVYQLREGLKNGVCYQIHSILLDELNKIEEISNINHSIYFESGDRPNEKLEIDNLYEKILGKTEGLQKTANRANIKICGCCGHDFDKHQLLCFNNDEASTPTDGWIICPEEDCSCFQTWSADYKGK